MPPLQNSTMVCGCIDTEWKPWLCQELSQTNRSHSSVPHLFPHYLNTSWTHSIFQLKKAAQQGQGAGRAGLTFCQACMPNSTTMRANTTLAQEHSSEAGSSFNYKETLLFSPTEKHPNMLKITACVSLFNKKSKKKCFSFVEFCLHYPCSKAPPASPWGYIHHRLSK